MENKIVDNNIVEEKMKLFKRPVGPIRDIFFATVGFTIATLLCFTIYTKVFDSFIKMKKAIYKGTVYSIVVSE